MTEIRSRRLLLVALVLLVLGCAAARQVVPTPTVRVDSVDFTEVSPTSLTLQFGLEVRNPYASDLPLTGLDYALSTGGKRFLEGSVLASHSIPAGRTEIVPVPVRVPYWDLYEALGTITPGSKVTLRSDLGVKLSAPILGEIRVPLENEAEIPVPSLP